MPDRLHFLDDAHSFDFVLETRDVIVEGEAPKIAVTAREDAEAELVDGELEILTGAIVEREDLPQPAQSCDAPNGRRGGGDEKPGIAARIAGHDRGRGEAAQAIGEAPFESDVGI